MEVSDLELMRAAGAGDDRAFHALVDRHADGLFRAARALTRNRADAEDLLQETMVGAYRGLSGFAGRSSVKTWLTQILMRQAAKAWHKSKNARNTLSLQARPADRQFDDPADGGSASARSTERRLDVTEVLQQLSPPHREVLVLREIKGMSYEEIASVLDVPRGTVESRLSRARAEFRQRFEGRDGEES